MKVDLCEEVTKIRVAAEESTSGKKRIDLLIVWEHSSSRFAVVIEAKLGHHITDGQLSAYREHLEKMKIQKERQLLIVVSSRAADQRNGDWRWKEWRDLLIAHERALCDKHDDPEYSRFRKTLWDQVG